MLFNEKEAKTLIELLLKDGKELNCNKYGHITVSDGCGSIGIDINYLGKDFVREIVELIQKSK